jgi:HSP20 family molecular chaperone IbpA
MNERNEMIKREETMAERGRDIPAVAPYVDIFENDNEILLHADMPGVDKKDIAINVDNGKLSLSGVRRVETTGACQWEEFASVEYLRTFSVSQSIDASRIKAELNDGVLCLHLPKSEAAKPRRIEIQTQ